MLHATFLPLDYFPIDPQYNVPAAPRPIDDPTVFEMTIPRMNARTRPRKTA
jgi:hypothetical protein